MESYKLGLNPPFENVDVKILYKDIKNVHLKVFRDYSVVLSLPKKVPVDWIEDFLSGKSNWIVKQLSKYKQSSGHNNLLNIKSGSSTQVLGKDIRIYKKISQKNYVAEDEKTLILYLKSVDDEILAQRILENWWRKKATQIFFKEVDCIFNDVFRKYKLEKPIVKIRKMKTLWGSCTPQKSKITLNEYLLKADLRCIQYVVLHELTHLLYPYHNKGFYDFLTIQMPDWKTRKEQLDKEVVQGL